MSIGTIEGEHTFHPETPLWRYMDLSKFMMLVQARLFIPTLGTLRQDADPKEGSLALRAVPDPEIMLFGERSGEDFRAWLSVLSEGGRTDIGDAAPDPSQTLSAGASPTLSGGDLEQARLRHLGSRRAIWCWGSTPDLRPREEEPWESMAMWNSYARSGVAIKTRFECLEAAVAASADLEAAHAIALKVRYSHQGDPIPGLVEDCFVKRPFRPFAFKNKSYEFESEVRIAFRIKSHPASPRGVNVGIDPSVLLREGEVVISPCLHHEEALAVKSVVEGLLKNLGATANVRVSDERQEFDPVIIKWIDSLGHPEGISCWRFEPEERLPQLLEEL